MHKRSNFRLTRSSVITTFFIFAVTFSAFAAQFTVFNKVYTRAKGKPQLVADNFTVLNPQTKWLIKVTELSPSIDRDDKKDKGKKDEDRDKDNEDTNFTIYLNGREILKSHRCNSRTHTLQEQVTLKSSNAIIVELRGKPGSRILVEINGEDTSAPSIKWETPLANQSIGVQKLLAKLQIEEDVSGFDRSSFQVTLDNAPLLNKFSGFTKSTLLANLSANLDVTEGAHTLSAKIKNYAGLVASKSVSFLVDLTPPSISNLSPASGTIVDNSKPNISANYSDLGSGIDLSSIHLKLDGTDVTSSSVVTATSIAFDPSSDLSLGTHTIDLSVKDKVGLLTTASSTFTAGSDPNLKDQDGDTFTPNSGDCNDHNPNINPNALDLPSDGIDQNCDGVDTVRVPNVVGFVQSGAATAILAVNLKVGAVTSDYSDTVPSGKIISQSPSAGEIVPQGSDVGFMISLGTVPNNNIPPDPATVAPAISKSGITNFYDATSFLYTGARPIQTGVEPDAINPVRTAVIRGKVLDKSGNPLSGVKVTILKQPELGQTFSRLDGMFDIVVNGGGDVIVNYQKDGYLDSSRQIHVPWQDYVTLPDIVMIQADTQVTAIDLTSPVPIQVARGSVSTDKDGSRQGTILIPQGTQATMSIPGQADQPLSNLHIRITEYTVGDRGPATMPAELPPTSAYTYAFDINADEAVAAGATEIKFNQPLVYYVDNFLDFPAGTGAPLGNYDEKKGQWIPYDNGRVIKILSVDNNIAQLDIDGSGQPATDQVLSALGITLAERQQLASLYSAGKSVWRVLIPHFSPYDINEGIVLASDAIAGKTKIIPGAKVSLQPPCHVYGSIIECQTQVLGEEVDVPGTPVSLNYRSDRTLGHKASYSVQLNLSPDPIPSSLKRIILDTSIAGKTTHQEFAPQDNLIVPFVWDGKDVYGRVIKGPQVLSVNTGYVYDSVYGSVSKFGDISKQIITSDDTGKGFGVRRELTVWQNSKEVLGAWDSRSQRLAGWTLSVQHAYDPISHTLYMGDGSKRETLSGQAVQNQIVANAYKGETNQTLDFGPDGSIYTTESDTNPLGFGGALVRRIYPDGSSKIVAGGGHPADGVGDNGPATSAFLHNYLFGAIAVASDGTIYVAEALDAHLTSRIRKITPDGIITTFAGGGDPSIPNTSGLATKAFLDRVQSLAVAPDGSVYIGTRGDSTVSKVDTAGYIYPIAGPIVSASISLGPDGSVYVTDIAGHCIWRIYPSGAKERIAANNCDAVLEKNCFQFKNQEFPWGMTVTPDGSVYFSAGGANTWANFIFRLNNGALTKLAGSDTPFNPITEGLSTQVAISPGNLKFSPDGSLYSQGFPGPIQKLSPALPEFNLTDIQIASEDGSELYVFDSSGRHLRTISTLTGITLYQFAYTANGLSTITDKDGNVTTIERDTNGDPSAIVGPFGQRTVLHVDANGYLDKVTQPNGDAYQMVTSASGLLAQFTNPRNNSSKFTYDALGQLQVDENAQGIAYKLDRTNISNGYEVTLKDALDRTTIYHNEFFDNGEEHRLNTTPDGLQNSMVIRPDYSVSSSEPDGTSVDLVRSADARFGMQAPLIKSQTIHTPSGLTSVVSTSRTTTLANPNDLLSVVNQSESLNLNGKAYTAFYDIPSKTKTVNSPEGRFAVSTFDNLEHVTKQQFANFTPINYTYDSQGRLKQTTQGQGAETRTLTLTYRPDGFLNDVTNSLNEKVSFDYDLKGRVLKQTLPDGRFIQYTYDGNDNVTSITPPGQPTHQFVYSVVDLVDSYTPPTVSNGGQTTYFYNPAKQLKTITRPDAQTVNYDYDTAGRLSVMTTPRGNTTYSYDPTTGNLITITSPDGGTLGYAYDGSLLLSETWGGTITGSVSQTYNNDFRVITQSINGGSTVNFVYDADGLLTQTGSLVLSRNLFTGFLTGTTLGSFTTSFGYNDFGELANDTAAYSGTSYLEHQYTYDTVGRILTKSETDQSKTDQYLYTYDHAGRLTDVTKNNIALSHYEYDSNGNRLSRSSLGVTESATYDAQDRLLTYGNLSFTYTSNGELKSKTDSSNGQTTQYKYDVLGNLLQATLPDGKVIDYIIDGNDRRIGKKVNGTLVQGFLYEDELSPVAELDASNNIVSRFVYGTKGNVPDYMDKGGKTYRFITDHLGSVRMVVDTTDGSIAQRMDYDEFGRILNDTNPGFQPFGFAGGIYDSQTGLTRFGARDYDSFTGRWTAKDPIGFEGGDTNLYGYVLADPVNLVDPGGLLGLVNGGFINQLLKMADRGLKRTIKSLTRNILEHEAKNPSSHHLHEIDVFKAQLDLAKKEAEKRGLKDFLVIPVISPKGKDGQNSCPLKQSEANESLENNSYDDEISIWDLLDILEPTNVY